MRTLWAVASITYKEGIRQRALYGAVLFALAVIFFSVLFAGLFMRDILKITLDLCLAAVSCGGLLVPFFLAVALLSRDLERRTVFTILARPVSRAQYLLGKFCGLALLTGAVMAVLAGATAGAVVLSRFLYGPVYFTTLSWSGITVAVLFAYLGIILLLATVVLWATVTTSSFLATLLTLATYLVGQTAEDLVRFMAARIPGVDLSPVVEKTVTLAMYLFPNLAAFDLKLAAAHGVAIPAAHLGFLLLYGLCYTCAILGLAVLVFQRRDLT